MSKKLHKFWISKNFCISNICKINVFRASLSSHREVFGNLSESHLWLDCTGSATLKRSARARSAALSSGARSPGSERTWSFDGPIDTRPSRFRNFICIPSCCAANSSSECLRAMIHTRWIRSNYSGAQSGALRSYRRSIAHAQCTNLLVNWNPFVLSG